MKLSVTTVFTAALMLCPMLATARLNDADAAKRKAFNKVFVECRDNKEALDAFETKMDAAMKNDQTKTINEYLKLKEEVSESCGKARADLKNVQAICTDAQSTTEDAFEASEKAENELVGADVNMRFACMYADIGKDAVEENWVKKMTCGDMPDNVAKAGYIDYVDGSKANSDLRAKESTFREKTLACKVAKIALGEAAKNMQLDKVSNLAVDAKKKCDVADKAVQEAVSDCASHQNALEKAKLDAKAAKDAAKKAKRDEYWSCWESRKSEKYLLDL